jgi:hypothetical protein
MMEDVLRLQWNSAGQGPRIACEPGGRVLAAPRNPVRAAVSADCHRHIFRSANYRVRLRRFFLRRDISPQTSVWIVCSFKGFPWLVRVMMYSAGMDVCRATVALSSSTLEGDGQQGSLAQTTKSEILKQFRTTKDAKHRFAGAGPCGRSTPGLPCPRMPCDIEASLCALRDRFGWEPSRPASLLPLDLVVVDPVDGFGLLILAQPVAPIDPRVKHPQGDKSSPSDDVNWRRGRSTYKITE